MNSDKNKYCSNKTLLDIVNNIYKKNSNCGGWECVTDKYNNRQAKDRYDYLNNSNKYVNEDNLIEFMGSTRKIFIDYIVKEVINKIDNSKYKKFLKNNNLRDVILMNAFGSVNPTSDYDVTFAGPGIYYIVSCLLKQFKNSMKIDKSIITTMSKMFDSNFYVCPDLILFNSNKILLTDINIKLFLVNMKKNHYVPVPCEDRHFNLEIEYLKKKRDSHESLSDEVIEKKYSKLLELSEDMDDELYKMNGKNKILKNDMSFIEHILKMNSISIEAYYTLSSILVVVYGIQAKRDKDLEFILKKENYIIAGVENIIDLVHHQSSSFKEGNYENNNNLAIKVSKYIQRIFFCLNKVMDDTEKIKKYQKLLDKVVHYRSNSNSLTDEEKISYIKQGGFIDKFINMFNLDKQLTFDNMPDIFKLLTNDYKEADIFNIVRKKKRKNSHKIKNKKYTRRNRNK